MTLPAGTRLGPYEIVASLGAGGMGEVYLAEDSRLHRKVALKILPSEMAANDDRMRRFKQEATAAAALNHPNIAHIYEIGEHEGTNFIAMEFVEGTTLSEKIHRDKTELRKLLRYLQHVAEGLAKAHAAGIVHRDLKPDNIMITNDGHAKVLDFGLAKLIEPKPMPDTNTTSDEDATAIFQPHSIPGMVMGTVGYMSPEQAQGRTNEIDQRSDVFSFGCILYEAVTGHKAFAGKDLIDSLNKIIREPVVPVTDYRPDTPNHLQRIVRRCLAKDPDDRYQTIKDVAIELRDLRHEFIGDGSLDTKVTSATASNRASEDASHAAGDSTSVAQPSTQLGASSAEYIVSEFKRHKLATVTVLLALVGVAVGLGFYLSARSGERSIESIAVMPFVNDSRNPDVEYLSDGMTETLIGSLAQLQNLNVKPRSSVFRYKGREANTQSIGKELNVQAILNGRVMQRGQDLSLFVELIDVALDKVVWSQRYDRKQIDIVALQTDIARDVSGKLRNKLSGADEAKVTRTYTTNPEAYQLYLKGSYYKAKYTEEGYKKAIEYFQKAIEKDSNYALAYSDIAYSYNFASDWYLAPNEAMPKAKAAALKALELDNALASAHSNLGTVAFWYEWDWPTSERELLRSIELDPASSHREYGNYLTAMGRLDEAIIEGEKARRYAPLDLISYADLASVYTYAGSYDEAIETARRGIELDETYWYTHVALGLAYERKGQFREAIAEVEKAHSLDINNAWVIGYLGYVYAKAGKTTEAQKILDQLKELSKWHWVSPFNTAIVYAGLNEKDLAFEWISKAIEARGLLALAKVEIGFDNLRGDSRFKDLLKRLNLPQ